MLVLAQSPHEELFTHCCEVMPSQDAFNFFPLYFLNEFLLILGSPGSVPSEHLEEDDPNRPDIGLEGVLIPL